MTGIDNLDEVHMLEMRVDTRETSLGNFGAHVPNLSKLKLSNSIVSSVRSSLLSTSVTFIRRPFVKRFVLCYWTVVCPVCLCLPVLCVCDVGVLWPNS